MVYNPFRTELLLRAEELGLPGYCGFEMLVAQAVYAAEYFTGKTMDKDLLIETTHRGLKRQLTNISLIGMPGCGKSSIGEALAAELGKTYIDLDEVIELRAGMPIPDIFERQGEAVFRRFEAEAVAEGQPRKRAGHRLWRRCDQNAGQHPPSADERPCYLDTAPRSNFWL